VIDRVTWERAQPAIERFDKRGEVAIRGRRELQKIYVLAMGCPLLDPSERGSCDLLAPVIG
jgi:hypothetical protein